jgi:hypothetical protein
MSPLSIASTLFSLIQSTSAASSKSSTATADRGTAANSVDFSSSLTLRMAALQAQSVNSLLGGVASDQAKTSSGLDLLTGAGTTQSAASDPLSIFGSKAASQGLSPNGYNLSLFDPQSAYRMMSVINNRDVSYKAQFSELSEMKTAVAGLQQASQTLGGVSGSVGNAAIASELQAFTGKYNDWIKRFDATVKSDGVLAGTQAAEVSLYELEQSVENPFNGAGKGIHGLADLGLTIDQKTNLASFDPGVLETTLASNKDGAIETLQQFSANFAKSAELLNSPNNFIPNRLGNLDRVIDYIADNKSSLQAEFGLGDPARPSAQVAKALAAYQRSAAL